MIEEFEGLCFIPEKATHFDWGQHIALIWRVGRVVGKCPVGQGAKRTVDKVEIRCAESKSVKNLQILR